MKSFRRWIALAATLALVAGAATASFALNTSRIPVGEIAFSVQHGDGDPPSDIYVVRTDGRWILRTRTRLNEWHPVWLPDGRHIAFEAWSAPPGYYRKIYTMDLDGTHRRRLATGFDLSGRRTADGSRTPRTAGPTS